MSKNLFNTIQLKAPGKNHFDLTHDVKLSCEMGKLIPIMLMDCVPGDKVNIGCESLIRFAPMVAPVMHRFSVSMHYFFVPNRILWDGWEEWITDPTSTRIFPRIDTDDGGTPAYEAGTLPDYLGVPEMTAGIDYFINALPFAAYQAVYNEYYRDQNLIPEVDYKLVDGTNPDDPFLTLRRRAWQHDYFTSCLPFAQKGAAVDIPLGDVIAKRDSGIQGAFIESATGTNIVGAVSTDPDGLTVDAAKAMYDPQGSLSVEATTITDLRRAFRLQEWLELQARGGTRYTEQIRAQFNVISSDARLQRPEYITGVKQPIIISEILNTTGDTLPQGNMSGHGVAAVQGRHGSYFCEEHGYIIGIMSIMPDTAYQQGLPKHFQKINDQFEYYWPSFANIGEQAVLNSEVYAQNLLPNETFGYIPRYAEYKFINNRVAGQFKTTLNTWHAGRIFNSAPALNEEFIECNPTKRIFAVTDPAVDSMYCHVLNRVHAIRPMPKYGNPYM
ncbi:MAG: major capsid protein [Arizlama microvirus]|nr:MAG: major capsid protein [Arizlama microvirus]